MPVLIIGGYLGAGKTTLINHQLRHADGLRIAVLVNDFGDIHIDADLIESRDADVLSLSGGCLCCSFGNDLVGMLNTLQGRTPAPDLCLIELSGVALPSAVVHTARLAQGVTVIGTLVLADLTRLPDLANARYVGETVRQQLQQADWLFLNKPDLVETAQLHAVVKWLSEQALNAEVLLSIEQAMPLALARGERSEPHAQHPHPSQSAQTAVWEHRPIRHQAGFVSPQHPFASRCVDLPDGCDLHALGQTLADPVWGIERAKGLARDAQGRTYALQVTGGRWAISPTSASGPGRMVMIGPRHAIDQLPARFPVLSSALSADNPNPQTVSLSSDIRPRVDRYSARKMLWSRS